MAKNDGIERLRAEAAELAAHHETLGREAGRAWALAAPATALKRLADAAGRFQTVRRYVTECATGRLGLAGQLFVDIDGPVSGEFLDAEEVAAFWDAALGDDGGAIADRDVAAAFVTAVLAVWAEALGG